MRKRRTDGYLLRKLWKKDDGNREGECMKGYKAFDENLCCKGFQYEVGKTYEIDGKPIICKKGFHFCKGIADTYKYYQMDEKTRICEVEALGDVVTDDNSKFCTNKIRIVTEITENWIKKGNANASSVGYCNTGSFNTGNWNTGDRNTGNHNTGHCNTGGCNTGNWNTGDYNTGELNTGYWNTGDWNAGRSNTGSRNIGNRNTGSRNTGNYNTGDWNTGSYNTGYFNTGDCNTGDCNTGNCNTGHFNTGNHHCGVFNTERNRKIEMFNKESDWTFSDWQSCEAKIILDEIPMDCVVWIDEDEMTDDEKAQNPSYKVTGGYLKKCKADKTPQEWWDSLCENDKNEVMSLPNFDADVFYECTGIRV